MGNPAIIVIIPGREQADNKKLENSIIINTGMGQNTEVTTVLKKKQGTLETKGQIHTYYGREFVTRQRSMRAYKDKIIKG